MSRGRHRRPPEPTWRRSALLTAGGLAVAAAAALAPLSSDWRAEPELLPAQPVPAATTATPPTATQAAPPATTATPATTTPTPPPAPFRLPDSNKLTPELAEWLVDLAATGVDINLTNDTLVLDTARRLCADTWTTPAAVGDAWGLTPDQAVAAAELVADACPEPAAATGGK